MSRKKGKDCKALGDFVFPPLENDHGEMAANEQQVTR
jgi:hypothetical protein